VGREDLAGNALQQKKQSWDDDCEDYVENPVGGAGMAGELHVQNRLKLPEDGRQAHGENPTERQADDNRHDGDEDEFLDVHERLLDIQTRIATRTGRIPHRS
jgi:hypothetical protein